MTAAGIKAFDLAYASSYSSAEDPVNMAGFMIENLLTGKTEQYHSDDVAALPRDGSVTLLDTRPQRNTPGAMQWDLSISS